MSTALVHILLTWIALSFLTAIPVGKFLKTRSYPAPAEADAGLWDDGIVFVRGSGCHGEVQ